MLCLNILIQLSLSDKMSINLTPHKVTKTAFVTGDSASSCHAGKKARGNMGCSKIMVSVCHSVTQTQECAK